MTIDRVTEMKSSIDTKPCPYCGGEGIVGCSYVDLWNRMCDWFVECAKCGATNINPTRGYSTEEGAVNAWNTRCQNICHIGLTLGDD